MTAFKNFPLWLGGFRPFFVLAMAMGILLPLSWGLVFSGTISLPNHVNMIQWHAHEMLFGFGGAVLIGFLLTASKNWVKIRGIHGTPLILLVLLWLLERLWILYPIVESGFIYQLLMSAFVAASAAYILATLYINRKNDSFPDNYFFYILLVLLILAKNFLVSDSYYAHGVAMSVGLFRLAFAVMFERTMTQFMKNTESLNLVRKKGLDLTIKGFVVLSIFQSFLPEPIGVGVLALAGTLLLVRWILWRPDIGLRKFGNATMYVGYFGLSLHFILEALRLSGMPFGLGTFSLHTFTFLCMGLVIPSMIVRISKGHTGRKPGFDTLEKTAISIIFSSSIFRLILPMLLPGMYSQWIIVSGALWSIGFIILAIRLTPFLFQPRIDGKV